MTDGTGPDPQSDSTLRGRLFEVVHNECRLFGPVYVEPGGRTLHLDSELGPFSGNQIHISFILAGSFRTQFLPWEAGHGDVLCGVIPLQLVLRAPILWTKVETLEVRCVRRYPESNTDEATELGRRIRSGITTEGDLNTSILKRDSANDCEPSGVVRARPLRLCDAHRVASSIEKRTSLDAVNFELIERC